MPDIDDKLRAQKYAEREGLAEVVMFPFVAHAVSNGYSMIACTTDGAEILVRLATAEEALKCHLAYAERHGIEPVIDSVADMAPFVKPHDQP